MTSAARLEEMRADVLYRRNRLDLYRAKVYGPRATELSRLEELEREYELAVSSLRRAERESESDEQ